MLVAIVNNNVVTAVVTCSSDDDYAAAAKSAQYAIDITSQLPQPQIGWTFTNNTLAPSNTSVWSPITRIAFMQRFTLAELTGFNAAAAGNPIFQVIKDELMACDYIILQKTSTQQAVGALYMAGVLTPARMSQILTTPPTADEVYTK